MKHPIYIIFVTLLVSTIAVYAQFEGLTVATAESAVARLDLRDGFGGRVVQGVVSLSPEEGAVKCDGKVIGTAWDTTKLVDGWHTLSCNGKSEQVCVRNDASIRLEEGRIMDRISWDNDVIHVVRNDVYVPNGVTLSISEGAIVKFAEDSRIIVEHGGKIAVNGGEELPIEFAQVADDSIGGNTDLQDVEVENQTATRIKCYANDGWLDNGWFIVNHIVLSMLPYLAVQPVRAMRQGGFVRIPVTVSGSRSTSFAVDWQTVDGTAKYGINFTEKEGRVSWSSTSAGVRYIDIPLVAESQTDDDVTFTIRLTKSYGANIQTAEATITIYNNADSVFENLTVATAESSAVRLDLRDDFGGRIAQGVMTMSNTDGDVTLNGKAIGESWDTTKLEDGWVELSQGGETRDVTILNNAAVHCAEGRLKENTTWDNLAIRLIRNNVYIPNGVTLTITEGTTVKFTEDTRIIVENGGRLQMNGSEDAFVQFAMATDDGYAGDTDMRDMETVLPSNSVIYNYSSGTVADNGYVASRGLVISSTYPTVTLHGTAVYEDCGTAYLSVTVSGSRNSTFYVEWTASDGTATFEEDYGLASGKLTWNSTNDGTKYIAIPIMAGHLSADEETFTVRLVASGGANIQTTAVTVTIRKMADTGLEGLDHTEVVSNAARLDLRDGFGGRIVRGTMDFSMTEGKVSLDGTQLPASWNSTASEDGWHELSQNGQTADICVLNNQGIALEEGRLAENTTWDNTAVHLVRNNIYVPNGVTLTMTSGAIVKFTEDTRIIVEHGGKVSVQGAEDSPVQFALATDDTVGGDTDLHDGEMEVPTYSLIDCYNTSNGWADNGQLVSRLVKFNMLPTVSIHNSNVMEHEGIVLIPVTVSGTRKAAFAVDWKATDGTAKLNHDYTLSSGRLSWTSTDNGTRYIEIPLIRDNVAEEQEEFTVMLTASSGTNIATSESTVSIVESAYSISADAVYKFNTYSTENPVEVDERADTFSRLARNVETLRYSKEWANNEAAASVRVSVQLDEDNEMPQTLHVSSEGETDGTVDWETYNLSTGRYLLAHETLDSRGGLLDRLETNFFINRDVIVHEGRLTEDETWDDSVIHVVRGNVVIPAGVQLSITSGAIVKFQSGCGIMAKLGGVLDCKGVTFTHIADDSIGGDTNLDGLTSVPSYDAYTVGGDGTVRMDSECKMYCKSATLPSGTLKQNTILSGNLVYKATGNLTIASGVTLTIEPGTVIKFDSGQGITVNAGATLEAIGTRAQPIVFTSIKDDEHGGDTNQDGRITVPNPGDWMTIASSGSIVMDYCNIYYGGQLNGSMGDVFNMRGGEIQLSNSEIAHSLHYVVALESGTWTMINSIVRDCFSVFRHFAQSTNNNCVFYDLNYLDNNASSNLYLNNCVIMNFANDISWWQGSNHFNHCIVFNNESIGGTSNSVGENGLLWCNPLFNDPENGDFTLKPNSPCIDAGDGTTAPELDYWGKPRMNSMKVNDTGIATENGCVPDIGVYEYPGTGGGELPDLKVNWVSGPSVATSGETITVSWQIENVGQVNIQGYWQDSVSVCSADEGLGQQTVELGDTTGYEILTVGEKKTIIRQYRIPAIMPGKWRLAVTVNSNLDIYERHVQNNRVESEETVDIQVNMWQVGKSYALQTGEDIALQTRKQVILELVSQQVDDLTLRSGDGFLPTESHFSSSVRTLDDARKLLVVPQASSDNIMLLRIANDGTNGTSFSIRQVEMSEAICDVKPNTLSAQVVTTMSFVLLDVSPVKIVNLKRNGKNIISQSVSTDEQGRTVAVFDLTEAEAGEYGLEVTTANGVTYSKGNVVTVEENAKTAHLEAWLDLPDSVREGRQYIGYIRYKNTGQADMNAPGFRVIGGGKTKVKVKLTDEPAEVVRLYGACSNPINVLRAGEEASVPFYFTFTGQCVVKFDTMVFPDEEYPISATFATWKELETAVHKAALRLYERGQEETDFNTLIEFAERVTASSFSGISGHAYHAASHQLLKNILLVAETEIGGEIVTFTTETDEDGYFLFDFLPGDVSYSIYLELGYTETECLASPTVNEDVNDLELLGEPLGRVKGYVHMSDNQPVMDECTVELWNEGGTVALRSEQVDENGKFEFINVAYGNYILKVLSADGAVNCVSETFEVDASNLVHELTLSVEYAGVLMGMVVDSMDELCPEEGLKVTATNGTGEKYEAVVMNDGSWMITEIPSGIYYLEVNGEEWQISEPQIIKLDENDAQDVGKLVVSKKADFVLSPAIGPTPLTVMGRVTRTIPESGFQYAWDFDGDGVTDSTEASPEWTYTVVGEHAVSLTLITAEGEEYYSEQAVTVTEQVDNVLCNDVILIHEMENPPYVFKSFDGTTLVMQEVDEYPVKPVANAKIIFSHDGHVFAAKILTSRKKDDCYYLTICPATLPDIFESYCIDTRNAVTGETRGGKEQKTTKSFVLEDCLGLTFSADWRDDARWFYAYKSNGRVYMEQDVGFSLEQTLTFKPTFKIEFEHERSKSKSKTFSSNEKPLTFTLMNHTFYIPAAAIIIPVNLQFGVKVKPEGSFSLGEICSWTFREEVNWGWRQWYQDSFSWDYLWNGWSFPRRWVKGDIDVIAKPAESISLESLNVKVGAYGFVQVAIGDSFELLGTKIEGKLADVEVNLGISLAFDLQNKQQFKISAGVSSDASLGVLSASGSFNWKWLKDWDWDVNAKKWYLWKDKMLMGLTFAWLGPRDNFTYYADPAIHSVMLMNQPWIAYFHPHEDEERLTSETHGLHKTFYYYGSASKRNWLFGDGTTEDTIGYNEVIHQYNKLNCPYTVTMQPTSSFLGLKGYPYSKVVINRESEEICPICGHKYSSNISSKECKCKCHGYYDNPGEQKNLPNLQSCDPNEIVGPRGIGDPSTQRFVKPGEWLDYTIYFENKSTADAAAQEIWINLDLNERLVDVSTFQLGEISFGNQQVNSLNGKATGKFAVTQEGTPFQVRGKVTVDKDNGTVQWYLRSYDPANAEGGYWPAVMTAGILPPNDSTHRGEGYVRYKVKVREDAPNDAFINAEATIVFDYNEPITTSPAWFNWVTTEENPVMDATTLRWDTSDDADGTTYVVNYWSGDPDPTAPGTTITFNSDTLTTGSWKLPDGLFPATWYWNVTKTHDNESSNTSTWSFDILASHSLTVHGGIGSGMYRMNTQVTVEANTVDGKIFTGWTADGIDLSDAELTETRLVFYMPDNDVILTANYRQDGQNDIELRPGWNLIAVPGDLSESDNAALFADLTAFAFDAKSKTYVHASLPLTAGEPLWIYSKKSQMIPFVYENTDGAVNGLTEESGWHLVGVSGNESVMIDKVLAAWTWNNGRWTQIEDDGGTVTLEARHAYFIYKEKGEATCISVSWIEQYFYIMDFLPEEDVDGDGLTNWEEYKNGTNPLDLDTDGDSMSDGWEIRNNKNPLDANDVDSEMITARYLVVDLSCWPDAESYPIRYSSTGPDMNDDTCRTTELWLRRIPKGTFVMGTPEGEVGGYPEHEPQHDVTLTQDYYMGVFECTQRQWELVMGDRPSWFDNDAYYAVRPVECVTYEEIRGTSATGGGGWPEYGHRVDEASFFGKLQAKTGLTFDLPLEAQWEYACRAGTTTALNSGKNLTAEDQDDILDEVCRYYFNGAADFSQETSPDNGTAVAGSYRPNGWGLYDMHGNVWEWCLDWVEDLSSDATEDPKGANTGLYRIVRGGGWNWYACTCRSAAREGFLTDERLTALGFRVACHPSQPKHAISVVNGTANFDKAFEGETVTITAEEPEDGMVFDKWVSDDVEIVDASETTTTFVMPAKVVTVKASYVQQPNKDTLYLVVDLSGGPDAANYPVRYSAAGPDLNDDTCRTTELWLRRIPKGTFIMGSPENEIGRFSDETQHEVTLTQDYYIGVFECTQRQWELVMGCNPSDYLKGDCRPVETVSYNMIRGTGPQAGAGWPTYGHAVDATSFMGKLQEKTGLTFDLPTEAQWEYACRAGTTTALNSGKNLMSTSSDLTSPSSDAAMDEVGRYHFNQSDGKGGYSEHTTVGSYLPNAWGLYDMHGNVWEWCLDWYNENYGTAAVSDPIGLNTGSYRVLRGGRWSDSAIYCRSAYRYDIDPLGYGIYIGFRVLCLPLGR